MVFLYGGSIAEIGTPREYTVSSTEYHISPVKPIVGILVAMMKEATETYISKTFCPGASHWLRYTYDLCSRTS
jgi:hypothetical protein